MHSSIKYSFTRDMFIQRVEQVIGRQLTKSELGTLVGNVLDFDQEMFDDYKERGWLDGKSSRKFLEFHPIEQVPDRVSGKEWDFGYWLYDKKSKVFICNLKLGVHEVLTGTLYNIYQNSEYNDYETGAEKYLDEHYGFYCSGSMNMYIPMKDEKYEFTDEEQIFESIRGRLEWRGVYRPAKA